MINIRWFDIRYNNVLSRFRGFIWQLLLSYSLDGVINTMLRGKIVHRSQPKLLVGENKNVLTVQMMRI